jgi:hypothetical protein
MESVALSEKYLVVQKSLPASATLSTALHAILGRHQVAMGAVQNL